MKIDFYNTKGEKGKSVEYPKFLQSEVSDQRIINYIRYIRNTVRDSIAHTKDRSEVSGGGKKPWKQKGTGRARHGSRRSPIWVGGGITFGPRSDRNYSIKMNKSEKRKVLLALFTEIISKKKAFGVSDFSPEVPKTALASSIIQKLPVSGKLSVISTSGNENFNKSFRNIAGCDLLLIEKINALSLVSSDSVLFTEDSYNKMLEIFQKKVKVENNE